MERDERFLEVINELQITAYTLEKEKGVKNAQAKVSHYKKGVTKSISSDIIVGLCEAYPQVNANYILTGNGPMFKTQEGEMENTDILTPEDRKVIQEAYQDIIEERDRRIAILEKEIIELKIKYRKTEIK